MKVMIDRSNNYFQEIKTDEVKMKADMIPTRLDILKPNGSQGYQ